MTNDAKQAGRDLAHKIIGQYLRETDREQLGGIAAAALAEARREGMEAAAKIADARIVSCRKDWESVGNTHHGAACERCHEAAVIVEAIRDEAARPKPSRFSGWRSSEPTMPEREP